MLSKSAWICLIQSLQTRMKMEHRGNYKVAYNDLQMIARGIIFCTYRASSEGVWLTYGAALSWSFLGHSALMIVYHLHNDAPFIYKKYKYLPIHRF